MHEDDWRTYLDYLTVQRSQVRRHDVCIHTTYTHIYIYPFTTGYHYFMC